MTIKTPITVTGENKPWSVVALVDAEGEVLAYDLRENEARLLAAALNFQHVTFPAMLAQIRAIERRYFQYAEEASGASPMVGIHSALSTVCEILEHYSALYTEAENES